MTTNATTADNDLDIAVHFTFTPQSPPGRLAEAELHFSRGALAGLKLIGFAIWERRGAPGRNVTFPARVYSVNGERRSFALLRPAGGDLAGQDRIRAIILGAWAEHERSTAATSGGSVEQDGFRWAPDTAEPAK